MITGIGIDIVRVERFARWHLKSPTQLRKVFADQEIDYCLQNQMASAQRFAVRFAAKEAFFKALKTQLPLLTICRAIQVANSPTGPEMLVDWNLLNLPPRICHLSMSHEKNMATAYVILERN